MENKGTCIPDTYSVYITQSEVYGQSLVLMAFDYLKPSTTSSHYNSCITMYEILTILLLQSIS